MITFFGLVHSHGGCGTELLSAIELLRLKNVPVRIIIPPGIEQDTFATDYLTSLGVEILNYQPGMLKDSGAVMCFGEGQKMFPLIKENKDRPRYLVYSDCMHYASDDEIGWWKEGLFDEFFFQSRRLADRIGPEIARRSQRAVLTTHGYKAFINPNSEFFPLRFSLAKPSSEFRVIKVGRDHEEKWHADSWRMFCGISAPVNRQVRIEIAGWGEKSAAKVGDIADPQNKWHGQLNITTHTHLSSLKQISELYHRAHVMVHVCDYEWEEAMARSMLEAIMSGVVVITDRRGGALDLIRHGETGFLVDSPDEASYYASHMAFNEQLRKSVAGRARSELILQGHGNADACWPWWSSLLRKANP